MVKGNLIRCYYRSVGKQLVGDSLKVEFEVDGEIYTHALGNRNWSYMVPALQFMGYAGIKPSDFEKHEYVFDENIAIPLAKENGKYYFSEEALELGMNQLGEEEWFDPNGNVWNGGESMAFGGMTTDPSTGNRAGVPVDGEE